MRRVRTCVDRCFCKPERYPTSAGYWGDNRGWRGRGKCHKPGTMLAIRRLAVRESLVVLSDLPDVAQGHVGDRYPVQAEVRSR